MVTGTFYLLAVGIAFAFGGLAAWVGASMPLQLLTAGVLAVVGTMLAHRWRMRRGQASQQPDLDIGQSVRVETWNADGTARVDYRGTQWNGELAVAAHAATPHDVHRRDARLDARSGRRAALTRGPYALQAASSRANLREDVHADRVFARHVRDFHRRPDRRRQGDPRRAAAARVGRRAAGPLPRRARAGTQLRGPVRRPRRVPARPARNAARRARRRSASPRTTRSCRSTASCISR